ncbi:hypothetical protein MSG28_001798 [Choristoneura fumiferana]|uniref:Uncharacterized protein n=1 Tax=Choristoneura fumiferana TaxID=7141 RepID=A0ACC0KWJ8_CHOFU|nr:hypothetical protein MSG28_001798 [Choristoneura fumiferana]
MCGITFEIYHELCGEGKHREETAQPAKRFNGACEVPNPHWPAWELWPKPSSCVEEDCIDWEGKSIPHGYSTCRGQGFARSACATTRNRCGVRPSTAIHLIPRTVNESVPVLMALRRAACARCCYRTTWTTYTRTLRRMPREGEVEGDAAKSTA